MNFRLTAILFGVVLLLVVGLLIYALTSGDPANPTDGPFAPLAAAGVKAEGVTAIELNRTEPKGETLVFEKKDGKWRLTAPADAPADTAALDALVRDLLALKPVEHPPVERSAVGLARPTVKVTLKAGDKEAAVHIGATTAGGEQAVTFLAPANDPKAIPMAVATRGLRHSLFRPGATDGAADTLVKWRSDFRTRSLLGVDLKDPAKEVAALTVSRGDKRLALAQAGGEWRFTVPAEYGLADETGAPEPDATRFTGVRPLLNAVLFLQTSGSADVIEDVPAADLSKYGLADADNPVRVQLTPKGRPTQTVSVGKWVEDKEGKPLVPARHYCRVDGDSAVFKVTTDVMDKLAATLADPSALRNRDLLPPAKSAEIDAVRSTAAGGYELRRVGIGADSKWVLYGRPGDPTDASIPQVQAMLGRLSVPRGAADVRPKPDDAAFEGQNLQGELTVWFTGKDKKPTELKDGKAPAEPPAPTGEPVTLRVGKQFAKKVARGDGVTEERAMVVVRRTQGKDVADFEVPLEVALLAVQPRLKLVNARPPSFLTASATRLALFRDGARTEYVKTPTPDPAYPRGAWTLGEGGPTADGDGVLDVLTRLNTLRATLVMEQADDLKALGLDTANPKMSATVTYTADKAVKEEVYHFGEPVKGDDKSVYMKVVGKPFVFAVPAEVAAALRTADLTDKVVFRAPRGRLKTIELTGWRAVSPDKKPTAVKAELQGGVWAGEKVDPAAVDLWADALRFPKAVGPAPVEKDKAPPPEYGFGESVLVIAVLKGEKEGDKDTSVSLLLGGPSADKTGVYAQVNGQEYRLLDARPFERLLARPPTR